MNSLVRCIVVRVLTCSAFMGMCGRWDNYFLCVMVLIGINFVSIFA